MAQKGKLEKFAEIFSFPNVVENRDPQEPVLYNGFEEIELKGRWTQEFLGQDAEVILELACGKGEYTLALAARYPEKLIIGVDIKGNRIWKGAKRALKDDLGNVVFLRTRIEIIHHFFSRREVSEIWITFPDPFSRKSKANRRLTSPPFLQRYQQILKRGGHIHLKTDSQELYNYTLQVIEAEPEWQLIETVDDVYRQRSSDDLLTVSTFYEKQHLEEGKTIKYLKFVRN